MGLRILEDSFFLFFSFISIRTLIDFSSSNAFFTFISKTNQTKHFINTYLGWVFLTFTITGIFLFYIIPSKLLEYVWLGEKLDILLVAFFASFTFQQFWPIAYKMAEASKQTLKLHIISIVTNVLHLLIIIFLWITENNSLKLIFTIICIEWLIAGIVASRLYIHRDTSISSNASIRNIFLKYYKFCVPLAPYTIIGFFYSIGDKWMLQNWFGSIEQSYFGIGLRFSGIALLATSALLAIFWKEVAVLHEKGDFNLLEELFNKTTFGLYIFTSIIVALILPWSSSIVEIFLGDEYSDGILTITILLIYPVHQCIGQITGSFLYAIEYTKLQSLIGCIFMITSLFLAMFFFHLIIFYLVALN